MGSSFFKSKQSPISGGNQNMMARAIGAGSYGARGSAIGSQKALGVAKGIDESAFKKGAQPLKRSAAYPKGPKV